VRKKDDDTAIVIGGLALLLMSGGKRPPGAAAPNHPPLSSIPWGVGWGWPVPRATFTDGTSYAPVVSNPFASGPHYGVDVMYQRTSTADKLATFPPGTSNGSRNYFAPPGTPILAAKDARVWSVIRSSRGWGVVLDHGKPFATFYQHLDAVAFPVHAMGYKLGTKTITTVKAGETLGTMGGDPSQGSQALRHLHFAVWYQGHGDAASVDPAAVMAGWVQPPQWRVP